MIEVFDFFFDRIDSLVLFFFFLFFLINRISPSRRGEGFKLASYRKKKKKEERGGGGTINMNHVDRGSWSPPLPVFRDNATVYRDAGSPREAIHFSGISSIQNTGFHRSPVSETLVSYPPPPPPSASPP